MSTMVGEPSPAQTMWRSATGPSAGVGDAGGAAVGSAGSDPSPEHPASNDADSSAGTQQAGDRAHADSVVPPGRVGGTAPSP